MLLFRKILIVTFVFAFSNSFSQSIVKLSIDKRIKKLPFGLEESVPNIRPVVALALSGGGARGLAHIGVLKAFEEVGMPIDLIVGTSMGSMIGGLYASGYSIEQLDSIAKYTDWNYLLTTGKGSLRRELFVDQKITEDKAVFSLRLKGFSPILPTALQSGQKLSTFLNLLAIQAPIHVKNSFDELLVKFRAVATNLVTGEAVILKAGSLSQALRASASVTFFLPPVKIDSLLLVDGGLVANIPAKIAREEGGEFVIAVNTTSPLHPEEELAYPWNIADQVVSIPMKLLNESQLKYADAVITPNIGNRLPTNFSNVDSLIHQSYLQALPQAKKIKAKIDSIYNARLKKNNFVIKNISSVKSNISNGIILKNYSNEDTVSSSQILADISNMCEAGICKNISAIIKQDSINASVEFLFEENPVINNVELVGVSPINKIFFANTLNSIIGKPFYKPFLIKKILEILRLFREKGYSVAEFKNYTFDESLGTLFLSFNEGKISSIKLLGNERTDDDIILRELKFKEGKNLKFDEIEKSLTNLTSTNLFDNIYINIFDDSTGKEIEINVKEKPSPILRFGFSLDNEKKLQFSLDVRDENLWGTGTELGVVLYGGARNRGYVLEQRANRIFNTYLTYKLNAFYKFNDVFVYKDDPPVSDRRFSRSQIGEYREIYYGALFGIGMQVGKFGNLIFESKYQLEQLKNKQGLTQSPFKINVFSFKLSTTIDTQDQFPYPNSGIYFSGFYKTAQTILGGEVGFINIGFTYKNYFDLGKNNVISPKIKMGFADATLPLTEQYSLGGQNSFFGMHEDEFRGRQLFLTSLEYRYKLPVDLFFPAYFKFRYDLGQLWDVKNAIRFKDLRHGIGFTLSFDTPIGPADFSVGRSFIFKKKIPSDPPSFGDVNFYFSIGYNY